MTPLVDKPARVTAGGVARQHAGERQDGAIAV